MQSKLKYYKHLMDMEVSSIQLAIGLCGNGTFILCMCPLRLCKTLQSATPVK